MQLIGSKYSTCRYLVQWNIHGEKFWKNGDKKHDELATFQKKYFLHILGD